MNEKNDPSGSYAVACVANDSGRFRPGHIHLSDCRIGPISKRNVFYGGSVIDVKFQLLDSQGNKVTTATATLWIDGNAAAGRGRFNTGNTFAVQQQTYVFKWDTSPIAAGPGSPSHTLEIRVTIGATTLTQDFVLALH